MPVRVRRGAIREYFDEAVSRNVQVDQPQGTVFMIQPECFVQSKRVIKGKRAFQIVSGKREVTEIYDQS